MVEIMSTQTALIPIFPLPVCIMVGGITELRIFEARYVRLVSEASSGEGFVISHYESNMPHTSSEYGTLVDIIDFKTLDNGLLCITVKGRAMVSLSLFTQDDDGLHRAQVVEIDHWSQHIENIYDEALAQPLQNLINHHDELKRNFSQGDYQNLAWVCARYVELLPLSSSKKQQLMFSQNLEQCQQFIKTLMKGE
tara:strand:+ start:1481 stop:2065 length:585 start_codon:yes stop_codon:yes gene_type:complete